MDNWYNTYKDVTRPGFYVTLASSTLALFFHHGKGHTVGQTQETLGADKSPQKGARFTAGHVGALRQKGPTWK